jgi:hypothetical protein
MTGAHARRRQHSRIRLGVAVLVVLALLAVAGLIGWTAMDGQPALWKPSFSKNDGLITNELAYSHPDRPGVRRDPDWIVTSGSLFSDHGTGWTGHIDGLTPDIASRESTGSAVFRVVSRRSDFENVKVAFDLDVADMTTTARTKAQAYDGVHVFLRYTSPQSLYAVSVDRRDETVAIKLKTRGGPSNGGEYTTLAQTHFAFPERQWVHEEVSITNETGGVRITLVTNGKALLSILDTHRSSQEPILGAGRVGLRGDNTAFHFRDFTVRSAK